MFLKALKLYQKQILFNKYNKQNNNNLIKYLQYIILNKIFNLKNKLLILILLNFNIH